MKAKLFIVLFLLAANLPVLAATKYLSDVSEGHWAYDAVYDLVKRGVTSGYPDGTFRGNKLISRFEMASFLSKLLRSSGVKQGKEAKLIEELRSELALFRQEKDAARKESSLAGQITSRWRRSQLANSGGGAVDYRLKLKLEKNFTDAASLKVNLDTMDSGFAGKERELVREMLDVEGKVKIGTAVLLMSSGPGDVTHVDSGLFPWEDRMKYRRPRRKLSVTADAGKTSFSIDYVSRSSLASGFQDISEVNARITQKFRQQKYVFNPRVFFNSDSERDVRLELSGEWGERGVLASNLFLGIAKTADFPHGLCAKGEISIGEDMKIIAQKIGSHYRPRFRFSIFDLFDRDLPDGSTNTGIELARNFGRSWRISLRGDHTTPGPVTTGEFKIGYNFNESASLSLIYQGYKKTDHAWAAGFESRIGF